MSTTAKLAPKQEEALQKAQEAGGLRYVRGGYWVQATVETFDHRSPRRPWCAPTQTVQALVRRGLLVWTDTTRGYPTRAGLPQNS